MPVLTEEQHTEVRRRHRGWWLLAGPILLLLLFLISTVRLTDVQLGGTVLIFGGRPGDLGRPGWNSHTIANHPGYVLG